MGFFFRSSRKNEDHKNKFSPFDQLALYQLEHEKLSSGKAKQARLSLMQTIANDDEIFRRFQQTLRSSPRASFTHAGLSMALNQKSYLVELGKNVVESIPWETHQAHFPKCAESSTCSNKNFQPGMQYRVIHRRRSFIGKKQPQIMVSREIMMACREMQREITPCLLQPNSSDLVNTSVPSHTLRSSPENRWQLWSLDKSKMTGIVFKLHLSKYISYHKKECKIEGNQMEERDYLSSEPQARAA